MHRPLRTGTRAASRFTTQSDRLGSDDVDSSNIDSSNLETAESMDDRDTAGEGEFKSPAITPPARRRGITPSYSRKKISVVWEKRYKRLYVSPMMERVPGSMEERRRCRTCSQWPSTARPVVECRVCRAFFHPMCEDPPFTWAFEASHIVCSHECLDKLRSRVQWLQEPNMVLASGHIRNLALCVSVVGNAMRQSRGRVSRPQPLPSLSLPVGACVVIGPAHAEVLAVVRAVYFDQMAATWFFYSVVCRYKGAADTATAHAAIASFQIDSQDTDHPSLPLPSLAVTRSIDVVLNVPAHIQRRHMTHKPSSPYAEDEPPEYPCAALSTQFPQTIEYLP
jgi:hypothetical protein